MRLYVGGPMWAHQPWIGARAETLAIQLPGSFGPSELSTLARFIDDLPVDAHHCAVEVRHPAFFDDSPAARALDRLLARSGVERIGFDTTTMFARPPSTSAERNAWANKPRLPRRTEALTDRPIVRFLGA